MAEPPIISNSALLHSIARHSNGGLSVNRNFDIAVPRLSRPAIVGLIPLILLTLFAVGVFIGTYMQLVKPADDRLARAQKAYQQAKVAWDQNHASRQLNERVRDAQKRVDQLWQSLPSQRDFAALAMAIAELARSEQVSIPGMSYHMEKPEGRMPVKATVSFKVTGEYGAIYRFIHRLETSGSYVVVESLDASRADKAHRATSNLVVFNMTVATFLRPSEPAPEMS